MLRSIGISYDSATGKSYAKRGQTCGVRRAPITTFWGRLQEAMLDKKIKPTQTAAAELIGLSQPAAYDWANGRFPTMENAVALAERLDVAVEWLLTGRGPKRSVPSDSYAQKLWLAWPQLSDSDKRELCVRAEEWLRRRQDVPEESYPSAGTGLKKA